MLLEDIPEGEIKQYNTRKIYFNECMYMYIIEVITGIKQAEKLRTISSEITSWNLTTSHATVRHTYIFTRLNQSVSHW